MLEKLQSILQEYMDDSSIEISEEMLLLTDLDMDSLDFVSLVNIIEEEFSIEISDRAMMKMKTIGDLLAYIKSN